MRHARDSRPINSQGWGIALLFAIGVLVLWSIVFYIHHSRYRSYRDVTTVSAAGAMARRIAEAPAPAA
jgi:hypothetical protein